MEIIVGNTTQITRDPGKSVKRVKRSKFDYLTDRRRNKIDRRKSQREGLFVSISTRKDRRRSLDRRTDW